ncbi:MAG: hypothetical protein ACLFV0_02325 [Nitriliruptoraceae bacterium]
MRTPLRRPGSQTLRLVCLFLAVALAGCTTGPQRGPVEIDGGTQVDPQTLSLNVPSCHGDPEITVLDETDTEIRIEVVSTVHTNGDDCEDVIETTLEQPLGNREVIDRTSGDSLQILVQGS